MTYEIVQRCGICSKSIEGREQFELDQGILILTICAECHKNEGSK